jgi:hypothetical protein
MGIKPGYARCGQLAILAAVPVASLFAASRAAAATNVVCIGEQTTETAEVATVWPGALGTMAGAAFAVQNDGDGSATLLQGYAAGARYPYNTQGKAAYDASIADNASIVIIGPWGEHDSLQVTAADDTVAAYTGYYETLIGVYQALASHPTVYVMNSIENSTFQTGTLIATDTLVTTVLNVAVVAAAAAKGVKVIDIHTPINGTGGATATNTLLAGDGHLSVAGAQKVAEVVYDFITGDAGSSGGGATTGASGSSGASTGATAGSGTTGGTGTTAGAGTTATTGATEPTSGATAATEPTSGATAATGSSPSSTGGGGTAGTSTTPSSGTTVASAGSSNSSSGTETDTSGTGTPKNSSSCTMGASGSKGAAAGLLSLFGLALLVGSRKRGAQRR